MSDPTIPQTPVPGVPPPPPKINTLRLWATLLAPSVVMILIMFVLTFSSNNLSDTFFTAACFIVCIVTAVAWGFFIHTIVQRFRGTSLVLLILAYPILQSILIFGIFFVGCLAIIGSAGV
jgi:hypothetical protein